MFLPRKKATGWRPTRAWCNTSIYDTPPTSSACSTPRVLGSEEADRLHALHEQTNPAELTRNVNRIQQGLIASAKDKTQAKREQAS